MSADALRATAATAALVLAVLSRGDALVLAALVALAAWRPLPAAAVTMALGATAWRWGSTSLEEIAGAQAVLGPAGWVGANVDAVAAWLGALALVLAVPRLGGRAPQLVTAVATGAAAAAVVAGPAPGGDVWVRAIAGVVATGAAVVVARLRRAGGVTVLALDAAALVAGVASLVAVGQESGPWAGTVSSDAVREGMAVAAAAGAVVLVVQLGRAVMEQRRT